MIPQEVGVEGVGRVERQGRARPEQVAIVGVVAGHQVVAEPVALEPRAGDAQGEHVAERHVDHAAQLHGVVVADLAADHRLELVDRLGGDHVDHAAGGVASVEGALRAAQHFDPFDVVELGLEQVVGEQRRVVQVDAGAGVARAGDQLGADAADLEVVAGEVPLGEVHVRNGDDQVRTAVDLGLLEGVLVERRHRDRHVLQRLLAFLGGDHQLLNDVLGPGRGRN